MAKAQREAAEEAERHRAQSEAADRRPCHVRFIFQLDIQCKKNPHGYRSFVLHQDGPCVVAVRALIECCVLVFSWALWYFTCVHFLNDIF